MKTIKFLVAISVLLAAVLRVRVRSLGLTPGRAALRSLALPFLWIAYVTGPL